SRRSRPSQREDQLQGPRALGRQGPAHAGRRQARGRRGHSRPSHPWRTAAARPPARRSDRSAQGGGPSAGPAVIVRRGTPDDAPRALEIWRDAVDATHGFLTPEDRAEIDAIVADWLPTVELWMVDDDAGRPAGFLVMDGEMIDALFVDPAVHGRGYGTALLNHAIELSPH